MTKTKFCLSVFGLIALMFIIPSCTDDAAAKRVAEDQGFTQVVTTGYRWSGCGDNDTYRTGFRALGPTGRRVTGVVCSSSFFGFGKTNTLRLD